MRSETIRQEDRALRDSFWLKEIAYQLAIMNERNAERDTHALEDEVLRFQALIATMGGSHPPKDTSL